MTKKKVLFNLSPELLAAVDHEAKAYYMTRSELIRRALIHYLQPAAAPKCSDDARERIGDMTQTKSKADDLYTDPEELYKIIHHQKMRAGIRSLVYNMKKQQSKRQPSN